MPDPIQQQPFFGVTALIGGSADQADGSGGAAAQLGAEVDPLVAWAVLDSFASSTPVSSLGMPSLVLEGGLRHGVHGSRLFAGGRLGVVDAAGKWALQGLVRVSQPLSRQEDHRLSTGGVVGVHGWHAWEGRHLAGVPLSLAGEVSADFGGAPEERAVFFMLGFRGF